MYDDDTLNSAFPFLSGTPAYANMEQTPLRNGGDKVTGARIRLARMANGLSLQDLADLLEEAGVSITRAALSKYENDKSVPGEKLLDEIARILDIDTGFFRRDDCPAYKIRPSRTFEAVAKHEAEFDAFLQITLEQHLEIDRLIGLNVPPNLPAPIKVNKGDDDKVMLFAEELRIRWGEPRQAIASVISLLEDNGFFVFKLPDTFDVPYMAGIETGSGRPFIGYTRPDTIDILREDLLKEVAYLFLESEDQEVLDHMARLFSRTMLLPSTLLFREFGNDYTAPTFWELTLVKQKYGISKVSIRKRLRDKGLLPPLSSSGVSRQSNFVSYRRRLDSNRDQLSFSEVPMRFKMDVLLAYKKQLITRSQAASLLPKQYIQMNTWDT